MGKRAHNSKLKIIGLNLVLLGVLYGLVSFNKEVLRPAFNHIPIAEFLLGIFPNFIAAFLISLATVNAVWIKGPLKGRLIVYAGAGLVFAALAIEEFTSMWGASTTFDPFDILASGLGAVLSVVVFEWGKRKRE